LEFPITLLGVGWRVGVDYLKLHIPMEAREFGDM